MDDRLIVELKTARMLTQGYLAQIMGYLRAMRVSHGMLIDFGSTRFELDKLVL